jgi:TetR/AcrR family transcriptional regulator, fatty acid biosynthesis regulator
MSLRAEQKEQTKKTIMFAALTSLSADRSYASLSLREVARLAEIAPTSFYRHFKDLEDLGVSLAEEAGQTLMELMRTSPQLVGPEKNLVRACAEIFIRYLKEEPYKFRFLMREKSGSSPRIRAAIKNLTQQFIDELAQFIINESHKNNNPIKEPVLVSETLVNIAFHMGVEFLDSPEEELAELFERFVKKLVIVSLGAQTWARGPEASTSIRQ